MNSGFSKVKVFDASGFGDIEFVASKAQRGNQDIERLRSAFDLSQGVTVEAFLSENGEAIFKIDMRPSGLGIGFIYNHQKSLEYHVSEQCLFDASILSEKRLDALAATLASLSDTCAINWQFFEASGFRLQLPRNGDFRIAKDWPKFLNELSQRLA